MNNCFAFIFVFILIQNNKFVHAFYSEAATGAVLQKKVFLKILQNSQENICVGVFFK